MTGQTDSLGLAVADAARRRTAIEDAIRDTETKLGQLRRQLREVANEQGVLEAVAARQKIVAPQLDLGLVDDDKASSNSNLMPDLNAVTDWGNLARTSVVLDAVLALSKDSGAATPGAIVEFLSQRNRDDSRELVSAALAYLHKKHLVSNVGRGQWVPVADENEAVDA